ncbi:hypothetical protein VTK26DRAFT_5363 [Humicola hyalothermophila]
MMRRGLWQQKRSSACLLCSYSHSFGRFTHPAVRPSSSFLSGPISSDGPAKPSLSTSPDHLARPYSVVAGGSRNGVSGQANARRPHAPRTSGEGWALRRPFMTNGLPSWATQPAAPSSGDGLDGLLPHERAKREKEAAERAAKEKAEREKAEREQAAKEQAKKEREERALAASRAKAERQSTARQRKKDEERMRRGQRAQEQTSRGQSPVQWIPRNKQPTQSASATDTLQDRFQNQQGRARKQQDRAKKAPSQAPPASFSANTRHSLDWAVPSRATPGATATNSNPASAWASAAPSWASTEATSTDSDAANSPQQRDRFAGLLPHERASREKAALVSQPPSGKLSEDGLFRPVSSTPANTTEEIEWKQLARRRRDIAQKVDFSRPADYPFPSHLGSWKRDSGVPAGERRPLEKTPTTDNNKSQTGSAGAEDPWAWADKYIKESKERQATSSHVEQEPSTSWDTGSDVRSDDRFGRENRYGRADRYGREDRVDRREKPKKARPRRREDDEDDFDEDILEERRRRKAEKAERKRLAALEKSGPTPIFLPEFISVANLAAALGQKTDVFLSQLEELGFEDVSKDNILTGETAALVAQEYGFEPTVDTGDQEDLKPRPPPEDPSSLPLRPPVVTIMGHVDHGKTTLLDYLRKSSIVSQEHGGITQHIGAFSVSLSSGKQITFLDTPGHAAFLSMRQRGANVTDMVILVVAADDSVMPQTLEALKHARTAKVPIIVAINKIDKPEANIDRVKSDLATHGVEIEDFGGDVQVVCVSGKTGQGMEDLEENILLLAEMLDIRAETDGMAEGWVLESTIKPIGRVATVLVKRGTLRVGDYIVAGQVHAKVRSLRNEAGVEVKEAPPGTAVEVLGWKEPPSAGDMVLQAPDEARAKAAVRYRQELRDRGEVIEQMVQQGQDRRERERERELEKAADLSRKRRGGAAHEPAEEAAEDDEASAEDSAPKTLHVNFTVKGDVHGSVEAVSAALLEQGNNEVRARVLHAAPGQITESDVEHAAVAGSTIVNFNNTIPGHIKRMAGAAGVRIMDHNVIYHLVEEVRERLADALPPLVVKKVIGEADVLQVFPINVRGRVYKNIAGCRIGNGKVVRNAKARVLRGGETVFEGIIETLKHVKKDVTEMRKGQECGLSFKDWDDLKEGDHIQVIEEIQEKRKL